MGERYSLKSSIIDSRLLSPARSGHEQNSH
jgi:hypothetical protein